MHSVGRAGAGGPCLARRVPSRHDRPPSCAGRRGAGEPSSSSATGPGAACRSAGPAPGRPHRGGLGGGRVRRDASKVSRRLALPQRHGRRRDRGLRRFAGEIPPRSTARAPCARPGLVLRARKPITPGRCARSPPLTRALNQVNARTGAVRGETARGPAAHPGTGSRPRGTVARPGARHSGIAPRRPGLPRPHTAPLPCRKEPRSGRAWTLIAQQPCPDVRLEHLADARARQFPPELHLLGCLHGSDPRLHERDQLVGLDVSA